MRTYNVVLTDIDGGLHPWRAFAGAFQVYMFSTGDRRVARRVVRLARRLGYGVRFTTATDFPIRRMP
jgi:hypothetical protein